MRHRRTQLQERSEMDEASRRPYTFRLFRAALWCTIRKRIGRMKRHDSGEVPFGPSEKSLVHSRGLQPDCCASAAAVARLIAQDAWITVATLETDNAVPWALPHNRTDAKHIRDTGLLASTPVLDSRQHGRPNWFPWRRPTLSSSHPLFPSL